MLPITIGILAVLAACVFVAIRRSKTAPAPAPPRKKARRFGAVELVAGANRCAAADALAGERLLAADAPTLPLDACDRACRCAYRRYDDRREINRRRGDDGLPEHFIYAGEEQRSGDVKDRRS